MAIKKEFDMYNTVIKYLGHSAFFIKTKNSGILIDPFISQNSASDFDYTKEKITHIFVTHGHNDHLGDAVNISKNTGAQIIAVFELANFCLNRGANAFGVNLGGKLNFDFGSAIFCPAYHSSSTPDGSYAGCAASILFDFDGLKIFHAGDTCLSQEFKTIKEIYSPDVAMLPVGGIFTMDIEQASIAAKWISAKYIIPMHYNTFPLIKTDIHKFKMMVDNEQQQALILGINEQFEL